MKVLSYIIRIFLLPIGPFRQLNKSIQLYSCKRWYIKFAAPGVPEEIQTPVFFKSRRFYIPASKCCLAEVSNSKSSLGSCEQRSTSFKETYLSPSTPRGISSVFLANNNLLPPHICVVDLFQTQEHGILDPYLVTISSSPGACCKLQQLHSALTARDVGPLPLWPGEWHSSIHCPTAPPRAAATAGPLNCS